MDYDRIITTRLDELPYLSHEWKFHKYIKKIGDRYFYTVKQLQAYYNGRKAEALGEAAKAVGRVGVNEGIKAYTQSWDPDSSLVTQKFHEKVSKACLWVSKKLGKAAANAAIKVIEANAAISKREVDRYIEDKYGDSKDIRGSILRFLNKYI